MMISLLCFLNENLSPKCESLTGWLSQSSCAPRDRFAHFLKIHEKKTKSLSSLEELVLPGHLISKLLLDEPIFKHRFSSKEFVISLSLTSCINIQASQLSDHSREDVNHKPSAQKASLAVENWIETSVVFVLLLTPFTECLRRQQATSMDLTKRNLAIILLQLSCLLCRPQYGQRQNPSTLSSSVFVSPYLSLPAPSKGSLYSSPTIFKSSQIFTVSEPRPQDHHEPSPSHKLCPYGSSDPDCLKQHIVSV